VAVTEEITITGGIHPPILLRDDPDTAGGKLKKADSLVYVTHNLIPDVYLLDISGARVTLEGSLILDGNRQKDHWAQGVHIYGSGAEFTMNGGAIMYFYIDYNTKQRSKYGAAGVTVDTGATVTMNAGKITSNCSYNGQYGGGVFVKGGTFIMRGDAEISGNIIQMVRKVEGGGGGVYIDKDGTFIMDGGKIRGNSVTWNRSDNSTITQHDPFIGGGGVNIRDGTFTMTAGEISGNSSNTNGGGILVMGHMGSTYFKKTGGTVYGSDGEIGKPNRATGTVSNDGTLTIGIGQTIYAVMYTMKPYIRDTTADSGTYLWAGGSSFTGLTQYSQP
jgi:hypothetical protein